MASDNSGSGEGWRVDTVAITLLRTGSGLFIDSSTSPDAGPTPGAVRTAKSSRYARIYSGTSPESVTADGPEL